MSEAKPRVVKSVGLNTSSPDQTTAFPVLRTAQNLRLSEGVWRRRGGVARLGIFTSGGSMMDFDGTNDEVEYANNDARVTPLGTKFTLEWLSISDSLAGTSYVLGRKGATAVGVEIKYTSTPSMVVTVTDSGATAATLTVTGVISTSYAQWCRLTRDGATVTLYVNYHLDSAGAEVTSAKATGTIGAATTVTMGDSSFGNDNGSSFLNGGIGYFRGFKGIRTGNMDGTSLLLNPRAPSVMFDYVFSADANGYILDRGPFGLHLAQTGSPTTRTAIYNNPMPIQSIAQSKDNAGSRILYVIAGGSVYAVTV